MNCQACGAELAPGAASCQRCGAAAGVGQAAGDFPAPPSYGYPPPEAGQPPYGQAPYGQAQYRQAQYGQAQYGQAQPQPYGWPPAGAGQPSPAAVTLSPRGGLAAAVQILLGVFGLAALVSIAFPIMHILVILLYLPLIPVFIVWFYRARKDASGWGWRQRWAPGWAIGAWFVPVIFLFFPYMIMADIWRAGLPADQRQRPVWLPIAWWVCWLLAWFAGFHLGVSRTGPAHGVSAGFFIDSTLLSTGFEAAAAVVLIFVVRAVSTTGVGRGPAPGLPDPPRAS